MSRRKEISAERYWQLFCALEYGDKVPRKEKKAIMGTRVSRNKLRRMLAKVQVIQNKYPKPSTIINGDFCPKCGCLADAVCTGNMSEYPEHYEKFTCLRCDFLLGLIDNSPYYSAFEFPEDNYEIP